MPPRVQTKTVYVAACAARHANNISCLGDQLIYSRSRSPVVFCLRSKQPIAFLLGHTDEVNGLSLVDQACSPCHPPNFQKSYVISTALDKSCIIWMLNEVPDVESRELKHAIKYQFTSPNDEPFITRSCLLDGQDDFISITTTIDGSIFVHHNEKLAQTIATKQSYFYSKIHLVRLNEHTCLKLLFISGSDNLIHVYQIHENVIWPLFELSGHSDWTRCIDTLDLVDQENTFLLASASQDSFVRVWLFKIIDFEHPEAQSTHPNTSHTLKVSTQDSNDLKLVATLETVLSGHTGAVNGLCFARKKSPLELFTCSTDKSVVRWRAPLPETSPVNGHQKVGGAWKVIDRVGETGESNLPFLGVCLSYDEWKLYAHSLRGAIHSWQLCENDKLDPQQLVTGHFEPVTDLSWDKCGAYLLSASLDKTCRLHAVTEKDNSWHEITRPQVHGHELNCLVSLNFSNFASGADEKTIRTFGATQFFLKNFSALTGATLPASVQSEMGEYPLHAQLPALGLSNRGAVSPFDLDANDNDKDQSGDAWYSVSKLVEKLTKADHLDAPPIEELLLQSTLWWETNKLYGHGNELFALAVDSESRFLASASKANRADLARIIIWETSSYRKSTTIEHHSLTVTRLRFSPNDRYLLSVSRDRTWCLSEKTGTLRDAYKRLTGTTKANSVHERIIWDCCWTYDSNYFMTVARDRNAILWSVSQIRDAIEGGDGTGVPKISFLSRQLFSDSIQAVDTAKANIEAGAYLFALGMEDGSLSLQQVQINPLDGTTSWTALHEIDQFHQMPIRRLAFKPNSEDAVLLLASGADDCLVKLTSFALALP